ncbi:MAG: DUF4124 domain-containing protein [Deltaproteobacteria bacterium]|nr:DUF4124 domain-containing protein [Deltaproteobacteria bacterium]MBI3077084.1 DUF4124 domain-containing protein [Deltaproteobacteria bacterium]
MNRIRIRRALLALMLGATWMAGLTLSPMLAASGNAAEVYRWVDDKGVVHFTDSPENIPTKYRRKTDILRLPSTPISQGSPGAPPASAASPTGPAGQPPGGPAPGVPPATPPGAPSSTPVVSAAAQAAETARREVRALQEGLEQKRKYVELFERGRRSGVLYSQDEIKKYNDSVGEIPRDEAKLKEQQSRLEELERAAEAGAKR